MATNYGDQCSLSILFHSKRFNVEQLVQVITLHGLSYKERLIHLNLLPLMYHLELLDVAFFVTSIKNISNRFDISKYIEISTGKTRSSNKTTIKHKFASSSKHHHFYFNRISRLWNSLPSTDLTLSPTTIKHHLKQFFWSHFTSHFDSDSPCSYHLKCACCKCIFKRQLYNYNFQ